MDFDIMRIAVYFVNIVLLASVVGAVVVLIVLLVRKSRGMNQGGK